MKYYRAILILLAIPVLVALAVWWLGDDHGVVLIEHGGIEIEMSLVTAILGVLLLWLVLWLVFIVLRWPFRFWFSSVRKRGRQRFFDGVLDLASGRPARAEQKLLKASKLSSLKLSALIAAYAAAHVRADRAREAELLAELARAPQTSRLAAELRARNELADGRAGTAIELLTRLEQKGDLSPIGARTFAEALAQRGRAREALALLPRIQQSQQMSTAVWAKFEARLLARAVTETTDAVNLHSLWSELNRDQKRLADVALAYARRAVKFNLIAQAAIELEATLKHDWSPSVIIAYGILPRDLKAPPRLNTAEAWLPEHPQDSALLLTLGRLARQEHHWIKNEDYLRRAIASDATSTYRSEIWEELGRGYAEQGDAERAARALSNALAAQHGESPKTLIGKHQDDDLLSPIATAEERDTMGIPHLPGVSTP